MKKRPNFFRDFTLAGLRHEPVVELTASRDPNLRFTTFENSIFVQKTDISKTTWINA